MTEKLRDNIFAEILKAKKKKVFSIGILLIINQSFNWSINPSINDDTEKIMLEIEKCYDYKSSIIIFFFILKIYSYTSNMLSNMRDVGQYVTIVEESANKVH